MEMRRLFAENMKEALIRVRDELGDDALIVETRTVKGGVEVLASQDLPTPIRSSATARAFDVPLRDSGDIKEQLTHGQLPAAWVAALGNCTDEQQMADWLATRAYIRGREAVVESGHIAVVGPTGAGKSNLVGHLIANHALRFGAETCALITLDTWRAGGIDQLRSIGRLLNVPVMVARDSSDLAPLMKSVAERRCVIVDTPGITLTRSGIVESRRLLAPVAELMPLALVVSATMQERPLKRLFTEFAPMVEGVCLSHVDEGAVLGPLLAQLAQHERPLWWQLSGVRLPDDLEMADAGRLLRVLLSDD